MCDESATGRTGTIVASCFGITIIQLNDSVVNVALEPLRDTAGVDVAALQWALNAYGPAP